MYLTKPYNLYIIQIHQGIIKLQEWKWNENENGVIGFLTKVEEQEGTTRTRTLILY